MARCAPEILRDGNEILFCRTSVGGVIQNLIAFEKAEVCTRRVSRQAHMYCISDFGHKVQS